MIAAAVRSRSHDVEIITQAVDDMQIRSHASGNEVVRLANGLFGEGTAMIVN